MILNTTQGNSFDWVLGTQLSGFGASTAYDPLIGDFGGDATADLMVRNRQTGHVRIASNDGTASFTISSGNTSNLDGIGASADWKPLVGNFGGSAHADLMLRQSSTGGTVVILNTAQGFTWVYGTQLSGFGASTEYEPLIGNWCGDGTADLMVRRLDGHTRIACNDGTGSLTISSAETSNLNGIGASADWKPRVGNFGGP